MKTYLIKTHRLENEYKKPHFFILSKGLNSGKPLVKPCPNCFVCITENDPDKDFLYWLCFGLWRSKSFHYYLRGSVIPFITIGEMKKHILISVSIADANIQAFEKTINAMKLLDEHEYKLKQSLKLIDNVRQSIFGKILLDKKTV